MRKSCSIFLTTALGIAGGTPAFAQEYWRVSRGAASCLVEHLAAYASLDGKDPLIIYLADCPGNDPVKALEKAQRNSALPTARPSAGNLDAILVYNRAELRCLTAAAVGADDVVLLPRKPRC